jgi:hypothetical protein
MSKLLIDKLTEEVEKTASEVEKTAEEQALEKVAGEIGVLDDSRSLIAIGEEMYKIAEELENDNLKALAADTYQLGERMGACLTKTASEDGSALEEALDIAEDMNKIASVYAEIADEVKEDETLNKMAETLINISNELTEEANEVHTQLDKMAEEEVEKDASAKDKAKEYAEKAGQKASAVKAFIKSHPKSAGGIGAAAALAALGYGAKKMHDK